MNDFSYGNTSPEKGAASQRRSIRDISREFSESEKRWSFLIELFFFGIIVGITVGPLLEMMQAMSVLGK